MLLIKKKRNETIFNLHILISEIRVYLILIFARNLDAAAISRDNRIETIEKLLYINIPDNKIYNANYLFYSGICSRVSIITHKEYLNTNARTIDIITRINFNYVVA